MKGTVLFCLFVIGCILIFTQSASGRRIKNEGVTFQTLEEKQEAFFALVQETREISKSIDSLITDIELLIQNSGSQEEIEQKVSKLNDIFNVRLMEAVKELRAVRFSPSALSCEDKADVDGFLQKTAEKFGCDKLLLIFANSQGGFYFYPYGFSEKEFNTILFGHRTFFNYIEDNKNLEEYGVGSYISSNFSGEKLGLQIIGMRSLSLTRLKGDFSQSEQDKFQAVINEDTFAFLSPAIEKILEETQYLSLELGLFEHDTGFTVFIPESKYKIDAFSDDLISNLGWWKEYTKNLESALFIYDDIFRASFKKEKFELAAEVKKIVDFYIPQVRKKGLELSFHSSLGRINITASKTLLFLAVDELLRNAVKYTNNGSIEVRIQKSGNGVELSISDTGIGIPSEELDGILVSGRRGSNTGDIPGTGRGLSLVSKVVRILGGKFSISSNLGEGTAVTIDLPLG